MRPFLNSFSKFVFLEDDKKGSEAKMILITFDTRIFVVPAPNLWMSYWKSSRGKSKNPIKVQPSNWIKVPFANVQLHFHSLHSVHSFYFFSFFLF